MGIGLGQQVVGLLPEDAEGIGSGREAQRVTLIRPNSVVSIWARKLSGVISSKNPA